MSVIVDAPSTEANLVVVKLAACIARLFGQDRLVLKDEFALHAELEARLIAKRIPFEREVRMGPHKRPDFVVKGIAVELKIAGGEMEILRQMKRYAADPTIRGVVLVSTKAMAVPETLGGKPVAVVNLWRNLL